LTRLLQEKDAVSLHGYTSAQGDVGVREAIADYMNNTHNAKADSNLIYLTVGAAASLTISLSALTEAGDEVILLAPFFPEYRVFVERNGAVAVPVLCNQTTFQPDLNAIKAAITPKTRAIIVNSPNNPTGAVMTKESIQGLAALLTEASEANGQPIYLIADEPYRELVYGDVEVPYLPHFYANTLICYSFSKSLSLPGERIGYILVNPEAQDAVSVYQAVCGAGRALGFVCAPALFQYMIPAVIGKTADISIYDTNRTLLSEALTSYGYEVVKPDGAFYLFVKALEEDAKAFCEKAKKFELLLVASDSFGCPGYVRISYCVTTEQIQKSLPAFKALAQSYQTEK
jgi:aspartate aminotransferase